MERVWHRNNFRFTGALFNTTPMNTLKSLQEKVREEFEKEFPCRHHVAECNGDCKNKELNFINSSLAQAYGKGRNDVMNEIKANNFCCKYQTVERDNFCDYCINFTARQLNNLL